MANNCKFNRWAKILKTNNRKRNNNIYIKYGIQLFLSLLKIY